MGNTSRQKPILIVQQLECEPPALLADVFREQGWPCHTMMVQTQSPPHQLDDYSGLVIMGGPQSASEHHLPHIAQQVDLLRQAIEQGFPVLGICLGAQLLARAAGADISPSPVRELGWYPVYPTPAARNDPLFSSLPDEGLHVFQWHGETFSLPLGAELLAAHPDVPHQAFRIGSAQYGLQFHVEVDETIIRSWADIGTCERIHLGSEGVELMMSQSPGYMPAMAGFCRQLAIAWLHLVHEANEAEKG